MSTLRDLNGKYAIDRELVFERHASGLIQGRVRTEACEGSFFLLGGHVAEYQPRESEPVLFMSRASRFEEGTAIRGGVPICFPWFGPHPTQPEAPAHGLVRTRLWDVTSTHRSDDGGIVVALRVDIPHWELTYTARFGTALDLELRVTNVADSPLECEAALHTYLQLSDSARARVEGLEDLPHFDKLASADVEPSGKPIAFTEETDRIYRGPSSQILVRDGALGRCLSLHPRNSQSTVVWNPWIDKARRLADFGDDEYRTMCCVETARIRPDHLQLEPAQSETLGVQLRASSDPRCRA